MILPFSTQLNGKPTYFPEKIIKSLDVSDVKKATLNDSLAEIVCPKDFEFILGSTNPFFEHHPKLHTIRKDEKNRWKPGMLIDFFINARQKNMFRFAPRISVVSTQKIEFYYRGEYCDILIDDKLFESIWMNYKSLDSCIYGNQYDYPKTHQLALNDGFECIDDLLNYFEGNYKGKIIHWTNLEY